MIKKAYPSLRKLIGNKEFCQNVTFWKGRPCDNEKFIRCHGKFIGRCTYESCFCEDYCFYCSDFSSFVCPVEHKKCQPKDTWICQNNVTCIPTALVCDGFEDCPDGSDETEVNITQNKSEDFCYYFLWEKLNGLSSINPFQG